MKDFSGVVARVSVLAAEAAHMPAARSVRTAVGAVV